MLERGYWPSYNVPFFPEIYNESGYPQFADQLRANPGYDGVLAGKEEDITFSNLQLQSVQV